MKKILSISILLLTFLFRQNVFSQNGKWDMALYGGYSLPTDIISRHYTTDSANKLSGYHIGISASYNFTKQKDLSLTTSLKFNHMFSSYNYEGVIEDWGTISSTLNIVSLDLGINYKFLPKKKIHPFAGIELSGNYYTGNIARLDLGWMYNGGIPVIYKLKHAFRLGLQIGGGIEVNLGKNIGLIAGCKFNFSNLIGRSDKQEYIEGGYTLNDGLNPDYDNGFDIFYSQLYTGISFHL